MTPEQFNEQYPIGTPVFYEDDFGKFHETVTRSEAWALGNGDGDVIVKIEGRTGGFLIERITKREA